MSDSLQPRRPLPAVNKRWDPGCHLHSCEKAQCAAAALGVVPGGGAQAMVPAPAPQTETETPAGDASAPQTQSLPGSPVSCCYNGKGLLPAAVLLWGPHTPVPLHVS